MGILQNVRRGRMDRPPRIIIYGTEGIGKSTFAAGAEKAIFIPTEDGLDNIDCARFPQAKTLDAVTSALAALRDEPHDYATVVVDSLDWLEQLIWDTLCAEYKVSNIEKVAKGYARGYTLAVSHWRQITEALDALRDRGMAVVCIAHAKVERVEDPETTAYDRHAPRLHKLAGAWVCEWADAVLFAGRKIRVQKEDAGYERVRGVAAGIGAPGGERILRCIGGPACVAKNRYGLPETIPLGWTEFIAALTAAQPKEKTSG